MDTSSIVMLLATLIFFLAVYLRAPASAAKGVQAGLALLIEIAPRLVAAMIFAGLIQVLIPEEVVAHWMGKGSGNRGILIAIALGAFTPGGPMTHFPIIASFLKMGIGIGPLVSYLTAWALLGFQRIIMWELPFLGPQIVLIRILVSILFPFVAGWLSQILWDKFTT